MKIAYPCVEADAEERTLLAFDRYYPKWHYADEERRRIVEKVIILIFFAHKSILVAS